MTTVRTGKPPHGVRLQIIDTAGGLVGCLTGGEAPHVGGVVLAVPRASLKGEGVGCDCWVSPVPGHKDAEVAASVAKMLCVALNVPVSITAGIHMDAATPGDIAAIVGNCERAGEKMLRRLKQASLTG